ncbi:MAG: hypothetical protein ABSG67_20965 [Thermoguttaceae bacterium]
MKTLIKSGMVLAGFVAAFLVADAALYLRELRMPAEAKTSVGMYAFGDLILFVEVFGVSATVPTVLALYFLRPFRKLWLVFSIGCLTLAVTGLVAAAVVIWVHNLRIDVDVWQALADVGILRTLLSPMLAPSFLVSVLVAPTWRCRWILLAATMMEGAAFAS